MKQSIIVLCALLAGGVHAHPNHNGPMQTAASMLPVTLTSDAPATVNAGQPVEINAELNTTSDLHNVRIELGMAEFVGNTSLALPILESGIATPFSFTVIPSAGDTLVRVMVYGELRGVERAQPMLIRLKAAGNTVKSSNFGQFGIGQPGPRFVNPSVEQRRARPTSEHKPTRR